MPPNKLLRHAEPDRRCSGCERRSGHIINLSSMAGIVGFPGFGLYNASKFAVSGLTEALRANWRRSASARRSSNRPLRTNFAGGSLAKSRNPRVCRDGRRGGRPRRARRPGQAAAAMIVEISTHRSSAAGSRCRGRGTPASSTVSARRSAHEQQHRFELLRPPHEHRRPGPHRAARLLLIGIDRPEKRNGFTPKMFKPNSCSIRCSKTRMTCAAALYAEGNFFTAGPTCRPSCRCAARASRCCRATKSRSVQPAPAAAHETGGCRDAGHLLHRCDRADARGRVGDRRRHCRFSQLEVKRRSWRAAAATFACPSPRWAMR